MEAYLWGLARALPGVHVIDPTKTSQSKPSYLRGRAPLRLVIPLTLIYPYPKGLEHILSNISPETCKSRKYLREVQPPDLACQIPELDLLELYDRLTCLITCKSP